MTKDELSFFMKWYIRYSQFIPCNIKVEHIGMVVDEWFSEDHVRLKAWIDEYEAKELQKVFKPKEANNAE